MQVELYTTAGCPYSEAAREDLEWRGVDFVEYDVERDHENRERMLGLTPRMIPEPRPSLLPRSRWEGISRTLVT